MDCVDGFWGEGGGVGWEIVFYCFVGVFGGEEDDLYYVVTETAYLVCSRTQVVLGEQMFRLDPTHHLFKGL